MRCTHCGSTRTARNHKSEEEMERTETETRVRVLYDCDRCGNMFPVEEKKPLETQLDTG